MNIETSQITNDVQKQKWIIRKPDNLDTIYIKNEEKIKNLIKNDIINYNKKFELKTEAHVLRLAYTNNKLLSLSNSRTQILAHQIETTHRIIESINHRFLIADEVGLGKTIEAGLVLKELVFRYDYKRILIVCPASLIVQWQNELRNKFNEDFQIVDGKKINKLRKNGKEKVVNPWKACNKIICSLDFIKSKSNVEELKFVDWDLIIIDEAHRLRRDYFKSTLAYNAAEVLSKNAKSFFLLTATPFRGKLEELYYLVKLVDKNLLGPFQTFYNTYCLNDQNYVSLREKLSSVIIRKTKKEVGGFTNRHARTIRFELSEPERILYDATTRYIVEEFNKAMETGNRAIGFVMTIFQKLLDSSSFALLSALIKRRNYLSSLLKGPKEGLVSNKLIEKRIKLELADIDDNEDIEFLLYETLQKTYEEIKEELTVLNDLIKIGESIKYNRKGDKLKEIIKKLHKNKIKKAIIFTQFRATQEYLKDLLCEFDVGLFHGSLDKDQKEEVILDFKERSDILICTEAGGEGRNLQFCNVLINYDLPWSPLKIEQRIGRIHRFGQSMDVYIYNFTTKATVAERVLQVLTHKLKLFEESIGTPDILLGEVEDELNLNKIFMDIAVKKRSIRKINSEIDLRLNAARENYEKLSDLTITKKMDFNYDEYYKVTLKERQYSNKRIENFVNILRKYDESVDQFLSKKQKINRLYKVKFSQEEGVQTENCNKKFGTFNSKRALNNDSLEFLAFGNPIINHLVNICIGEEFGGSTGVKFIRYDKKISGMIFNYLITYKSIEEHQELVPVFIASNNSVKKFEIDEIEKQAAEELTSISYKCEKYASQISRIRNRCDTYFESAKDRILDKAGSRVLELRLDLDGSMSPEIEKINESYNKNIKEYEEQLSRQICRMKWYKKDMKGAITRTKNKLKKLNEEKQALLDQYREYSDVKYKIELINTGILITLN